MALFFACLLSFLTGVLVALAGVSLLFRGANRATRR